MSDGMVFCRACGGTMHSAAPFCPHCGAPQGAAGGGDGIERSLGASVAMCFSKYVTFEGRAPRAEYWYFTLFGILVNLAFTALDSATNTGLFGILGLVFALAVFLPSIAVTARRLHDIDKSGWWMLLLFVPLVGWIIVVVWMCTKGTLGPNRFGAANGRI